MKIRSKPSQKKRKANKSRFLFFPIIYRGKLYWLENVIVKKSFNGRKKQITNVTRTKELTKTSLILK